MDAISIWMRPYGGAPIRLRALGDLMNLQDRVDEVARAGGFIRVDGFIDIPGDEGAPPQFRRMSDPLSFNAREVWYVEAAPDEERAWARGEEL